MQVIGRLKDAQGDDDQMQNSDIGESFRHIH